jgi:fatty acid desaturase
MPARLEVPLARLRREAWSAELADPGTLRLLAELASHVALIVGGAVLFFTSHAWPLRALAVVLGSAGSLGAAASAHSASHQASARRHAANLIWTWFGFTLVNGLSASHWQSRHIANHHRFPNVVGVDRDIDYQPLFAIAEPEVAAASHRARAYYRLQVALLLLLLPLNFISYQLSGCRHLASAFRDGSGRDARHVVDAAVILLGHALWIAVPLAFRPASEVAL